MLQAAHATLLLATAALLEESDDGEESSPSRQGQGQRERVPKIPLEFNRWWMNFTSERVRQPGTYAWRQFRKTFRVSIERFDKIVADTRTWTNGDGSFIFKEAQDTRTWPLELKIMIALRWLGTGSGFATLGTESGTSETVARVHCLLFVREFSKRQFTEWVHPPQGNKLQEAMEVPKHRLSTANLFVILSCLTSFQHARAFKKLLSLVSIAPWQVFAKCGYCGAFFSMDVVHIAWWRCPAQWHSFFTGKEGFPTVAFNLACLHTKEIIAVRMSDPGARNDKTIVRYDLFIDDLRSGVLYPDVEFTLRGRASATKKTVFSKYLFLCAARSLARSSLG